MLFNGLLQPEYIIIDGGSTDGTVEIIEKYAEQLSYWVSEPDDGISDAFNKGIRKCNGEIIGLLNAGDVYLEACLSSVAEAYSGEDVCYADMQTILDGEDQGTYRPDHTQLHKDMSLCHPSTFIRRDAYQRWGGYKLSYKLAMDYELLLRFMQAGARFAHVDLVTTAMTMDGISNQHWKAALKEVHQAQEEHLDSSVLRGLRAQMTIAKRTIGKGLESAGLRFMVESYRRRFSSVKKN